MKKEKEEFIDFTNQVGELLQEGVNKNKDKWNDRQKSLISVANIYYQKKLVDKTERLVEKTWCLAKATWILAIATGILAIATIFASMFF